MAANGCSVAARRDDRCQEIDFSNLASFLRLSRPRSARELLSSLDRTRTLIFRGPDPSRLPEPRALLTNYGDNPPHVVIENSLFDPEAWITKRGKSAPAHNGNPAGQLLQSQPALHGGNFTLRWSEIRNVEDGVNYVGRTADWTNQQTTVEMNWIHAGEYKNGTDTPSDGRTHNGAFQFNAGRNVVLRGNLLGGPRDMVGYRIWPNGYNSGDDYSNASIMFKQEVDDSNMRKLTNILIEDNFFWGGGRGAQPPLRCEQEERFRDRHDP
ncbi:hypothetical protein [Sorangium sp. So ce542]|uniref:hypothetical protein n=1 Tax=Sorangium sp. So ce542 TaxID=3133316 RepID=UPI003F5FCB80